ncbi:DNA-binding CsgD family transcriptional regulator/PAS domain-containing protein [Azospirillum agricola]|uniref:helix-turn-helix transcriptional regulator n=1 Tax=Azospirillum agricola TaxID=1720247 RepID=UPI001AE88B6A|nr:helix-turn-helix transcriptional regulator [Azospirillum agricola]MBP2232498.1 DNA-binding CsgD family transcriptional regulator/PAS domain-containing protein [Azospirillum agricola]
MPIMAALDIPADAPPSLSEMAALAVRLGSGAVVFSPDDRLEFASDHFRRMYEFCDFGRGLTFDDILLASLAMEERAGFKLPEPPTEKLERTKRRRRVERMEFVREFPVPLMCLHWMHHSGWSIQIRAEPKHVGLSSFFDADLPAFGLLEALRRREELSQRAAVLDSIDLAVAVLGPEGGVRYQNAAFAALVDASDGLRIDDDGHVCAVDAGSADRLQAVIAAAAFGRPSARQVAMCLPRQRGEPHVLSVSRGVGALLGSAVLIIAPILLDVGTLASILYRDFGLTQAQAEVAAHVGAGLSPDEAAEALGKSRDTARTQLKGVFARLGQNIGGRTQARLTRFSALLSSISGAARQRGY